MSDPLVTYLREGHIAVLTLNRPEVMNAVPFSGIPGRQPSVVLPGGFYFIGFNSTRRLLLLPLSVSLVSMGLDSP